jgi:hypothetical protein
VLEVEIVQDLPAALEQCAAIAVDLGVKEDFDEPLGSF